MGRPKAVLLDFDDTLGDNSVIPATVERACEEIARGVRSVDAEQLRRANAVAWNGYWPGVERRCWLGEIDLLDVSRETWRRTLEGCGIDDDAVVRTAFETHQRIGDEMARLFDDVADLLAALRDERIATALVTNSSSVGQLARLEVVGLASAFDVVIISGAVGVAKPDPAIFEAALDGLGVSSADAWHVGDSLSTDVAGAAAAGIRSVWLNRHGRRPGPTDPQPDVEIASLRDLVQLVVDG